MSNIIHHYDSHGNYLGSSTDRSPDAFLGAPWWFFLVPLGICLIPVTLLGFYDVFTTISRYFGPPLKALYELLFG